MVAWWRFSNVVGKFTAMRLQFFLFWDNANNQKYVFLVLLKISFLYFQSKVATSDKWVGQIYKPLMSNFLRIPYTPKSLKSVNFGQSYSTNKKVNIFLGHSVYNYVRFLLPHLWWNKVVCNAMSVLCCALHVIKSPPSMHRLAAPRTHLCMWHHDPDIKGIDIGSRHQSPFDCLTLSYFANIIRFRAASPQLRSCGHDDRTNLYSLRRSCFLACRSSSLEQFTTRHSLRPLLPCNL